MGGNVHHLISAMLSSPSASATSLHSAGSIARRGVVVLLNTCQVVQPDSPLVDGFRAVPEILPGIWFAVFCRANRFFSGKQPFIMPVFRILPPTHLVN